MKIRNSFVSNSSSSSFCIFGTRLKDECIEKIKNGEDAYVADLIEKVMADKKLNLQIFPYGEDYYVGRSWRNIKDDQTGREFKEDVKKQIIEFCGEDVKVGTFEEAWHD